MNIGPLTSRFRADTRGASAVEFSLILIPLLLMIFGSIEFGRLMWTREALQSTAIAAARCMGVLQSSCATSGVYSSDKTTTFARQKASGWFVALPTTSITLNNNTTCGGVSGFSKVSITYTFQTALPKIIVALAHGETLTASACFPNQPS